MDQEQTPVPTLQNSPDISQQSMPVPDAPKRPMYRKRNIIITISAIFAALVVIGSFYISYSLQSDSELAKLGCNSNVISYIKSRKISTVRNCDSSSVTLLPDNKQVDVVDLIVGNHFDSCIDTCHNKDTLHLIVQDGQEVHKELLESARTVVNDGSTTLGGNELTMPELIQLGCPMVAREDDASDKTTLPSSSKFIYTSGEFKGLYEKRFENVTFISGTGLTCKAPRILLRGDSKQRKLITTQATVVTPAPSTCQTLACNIESARIADQPSRCTTLAPKKYEDDSYADKLYSTCADYFVIKHNDLSLCRFDSGVDNNCENRNKQYIHNH